MRSNNMIRAAKAGYIVLSAVLSALGVMMLTRPGYSAELISRVVGIVLIAFGVFKLIGYWSRDLYRLAFQHDLAMGILVIALGLVLALRPNWAMNALCMILGIEIITDGLFKVQTALDARRFGLNTWWLILALAVAAGGIGIALLILPAAGGQTLVQLLGASLIAQGLLNLCVALCAVKIIAHQQPDVIEGRMY